MRGLIAVLTLMIGCRVLHAATPGSNPRNAIADFVGVWRVTEVSIATQPTGGISVEALMARFRRDVLTRFASNVRRGMPSDRGYCTPSAFTGPLGYGMSPMGVFPVNFEVLESPGRMTVIDEMGLVRRVFLRSTPPPNALDESNAGTSVASWQGTDLLVETSGLNPAAKVIVGAAGTELGHDARIRERFSLLAPDVLQIVTEVTAPDLYVAPVTTTNRYRRESNEAMVETTACSSSDRSFDQQTGSERFDATPPRNLPPPPR